MALRVALIRQRPAIGDALLLSPLIDAIKRKYPTCVLTVVTDSGYMSGALVTIFESLQNVDKVISIDPHEWTTEGNKLVDVNLRAVHGDIPPVISQANLIYDCNSAFMFFEQQHRGMPPYGIAEFWVRHFDLYTEDMDLLPHYSPSDDCDHRAQDWMVLNNPTNKPMVGIVLRAGDPVRDWDYNGLCDKVATWLHTRGFLPVGIDPHKPLPCLYGVSCVGKRLDFVAALMRYCKLVMTPDTGLLHLAQAVGTPTVALWGIMPPELRVKSYNTVVVPKTSLGYCADNDSSCRCSWKFQKWSCLRRLTLPIVTEGLKEALHA